MANTHQTEAFAYIFDDGVDGLPQQNTSHNQNPGNWRVVRENPSHKMGADIRLGNSLHGSGCTISVPGVDYDSHGGGTSTGWLPNPSASHC